MTRCLSIICMIALLSGLSGCTRTAGTVVNPPQQDRAADEYIDSDPEDRPELPGDIVLVQGIPQINVYDVASDSLRSMDVEEYLPGVLAGEMKNDWPMEALKAQAILARTFVLKFISTKESRYEGADISTDVAEAQAYNADAVNERIRQAVAETRGLVLSDDGELPHAWFHAHSGGMTELPSIALDYKEGDPEYLEPVRVAESDKAPENVRNWTATFTKEQLQQACREAGADIRRITSIEIGKRGESGRAKEWLINGIPVSAPTLRLKLDASKLRSTKVSDIRMEADSVTFTGSGFGHGVGMSQWGAYELAERGKNAFEIIDAFFDDVDIVRMWK